MDIRVKSLKYLSGFLWLLTVTATLYGTIIQRLLFNNIFNTLTLKPVSIYASISQTIFIILLSIFTLRLWLNKLNFLKSIFICAIIFRLSHNFFMGAWFQYPPVSFFEDTLSITIGLIFVLLHNKDSKLLTIMSLRLLALATLITGFGVGFVSKISDPTLPEQFVIMSKSINHFAFFSYADLLYPCAIICLILICFRSVAAKYLFTISILLPICKSLFQADALTGLDAIFCDIFTIMCGMILTLLYTDPLRKQFTFDKERLKRLNIFRTIFLSHFSEKFHDEVNTQWKGAALTSYFLFIFLVVALLITNSYFEKNKLEFLNNKKYSTAMSQLPNIHLDHGKISTNLSKPLYIFDSEGKPFIYINTLGTKHPPQSNVKIYITDHNIIVSKKGHIWLDELQSSSNHFAISRLKINNISSINFKAIMSNVTIVTGLATALTALFAYLYMLVPIFIFACIRYWIKKKKGLNLDIKNYMRLFILSVIPYATLVELLSIIQVNHAIKLAFILVLYGLRKTFGMTLSTYLHNFEVSKWKLANPPMQNNANVEP